MKTCDRAMSIAVRRAVWVLAVVAAGAAEARESELLFDGGHHAGKRK